MREKEPEKSVKLQPLKDAALVTQAILNEFENHEASQEIYLYSNFLYILCFDILEMKNSTTICVIQQVYIKPPFLLCN